MKQKVSIATDETSNMGLPGIPILNFSHIVAAPICVEGCVLMNHCAPLNGAIGKHNLAGNVLHKGQAIVQQFHDCGYLIRHISPLGDPAIGPMQSSRVVVFGAGLVQIEGTAVGFAIFEDPMTPMLTCGKYPLPVGASNDSKSNSVIVGMDPEWDHQCGWNHIQIILLRAFCGQAAETLAVLATLGAGSAAAVVAEIASDTGQGFVESTIGQVLGDIANTPDVGRRYQERMQRRRDAPGADFGAANEDEMRRGVGEGVAESALGPVWTPIIGNVSNMVPEF